MRIEFRKNQLYYQMEQFIQVNGKTTKEMGEVSKNGKTEQSTLENGRMIKLTGLEKYFM